MEVKMNSAKIGMLTKPGHTARKGDRALTLYNAVKDNDSIEEYFILDDDDSVCGIISRSSLLRAFGGRYGFSLYSRYNIDRVMKDNFFVVDENADLKKVAEKAMSRPGRSCYDAIGVTHFGKYIGKVSVKDLVLAFIKEEIEIAADTNPLTKLPGNRMIQNAIKDAFFNYPKWALIYIDLDNFKAYNDAYSFESGDKVILAAANSIKLGFGENAFVGHVGGDDFVVVLHDTHVKKACETTVNIFKHKIYYLYNDEDKKRGYIISHDRDGKEKKFKIVSMSIAVITSKDMKPKSLKELFEVVAKTKKKAKSVEGNSMAIAD